MSTTLSSAALVGNSKDLVGEILSRLPLSSVLRFRLVCKEWCLRSTQSFIDMSEDNINQHAGLPHRKAVNGNDNNNNSCFAVQYFDNGESKSDHFNTLFFNFDDNGVKMKKSRTEYMDLSSNILSSQLVGEEDGNGNSFFHKIKAYYHIKLISSCRGFLLFTAKPAAAKKPPVFGCWQAPMPMEEEADLLILYNPFTKEKLTVIAPPSKYVYCGFYYHSPTKEHRILYRLSKVVDPPDEVAAAAAYGIVTFLVIELKNNRFMIRRINLKCPKYYVSSNSTYYYYLPDTSTPPVISNGSLHWIASEDDRGGHLQQIPGCLYTILYFGMENEDFGWKPHPRLSHTCVNLHRMNLLEMEGGVLCLCDAFGICYPYQYNTWPNLVIYVMTDYEKWTWVRRHVIQLDGYIDERDRLEYGLCYKALQILQGYNMLLLQLQVHRPDSNPNVEYALHSLESKEQLTRNYYLFTGKTKLMQSLNTRKQLKYSDKAKKNKKRHRFQVVIDRWRIGDTQWPGPLRRMRIKPDKKKNVVGNMVLLTPSLASVFQRDRSTTATHPIPIRFIFIEENSR